MKRVVMLREKIYSATYYEIDPNDPHHTLREYEEFGYETDDGFWNEYYRVGVVNADDGQTPQEDDFQKNSRNFYSYKEAKTYYDELRDKEGL